MVAWGYKYLNFKTPLLGWHSGYQNKEHNLLLILIYINTRYYSNTKVNRKTKYFSKKIYRNIEIITHGISKKRLWVCIKHQTTIIRWSSRGRHEITPAKCIFSRKMACGIPVKNYITKKTGSIMILWVCTGLER